MIYLKKFENHEAYEAATLTLPNVSLCEQENKVHYNPYVPFEMPSVDLGLPSEKLWAKYLLGMSGETDIENALYFAWGDTVGHVASDDSITYDWAHAPFNNGSSDFDSDYFNSVKDTVCPNGILASEYDAVRSVMGGNWRMPTEADFKELTANTTQSAETIDGVKGMRFISKTNTNSIFVPFIGYRYGSNVRHVGDDVSLWSSSLYVSNPSHAVSLLADSYGFAYVNGDRRYYGYGVLGVLY